VREQLAEHRFGRLGVAELVGELLRLPIELLPARIVDLDARAASQRLEQLALLARGALQLLEPREHVVVVRLVPERALQRAFGARIVAGPFAQPTRQAQAQLDREL